MNSEEREIWFRCSRCEAESYCGSEFDEMSDAVVMCPFCRHEMPLASVRLKTNRHVSN